MRHSSLLAASVRGAGGSQRLRRALVQVIAARAGYAESIGMRLLEGRAFERAHSGAVQEAVIDEHLARRFFPTGTPIGAAIPFRRKSLRIVGVVKQPRLANLHEDGRPQLFIRAEDWVGFMPVWVVKTERDVQALVPEIRRVIRQLDPRIPVSSPQQPPCADFLNRLMELYWACLSRLARLVSGADVSTAVRT